MKNYKKIEEDMSLMYRYLELAIVEPEEFKDIGLTQSNLGTCLLEMFSESLEELETLC